MNRIIQNSGKYCSSCNAPEKGNWEYNAAEDDWHFIPVQVEHSIFCFNLNAPLLDHISWDEQALHGDKQPTIPRPWGPSREGSRRCDLGSIASGGTRTYCTCSVCW